MTVLALTGAAASTIMAIVSVGVSYEGYRLSERFNTAAASGGW